MEIELISRRADEGTVRPHLLFIHGGFHGAWCWDEHFLPWFQTRGWSSHALSLRGHGQSEGVDSIRSWTLSDYCDDVFSVLDELDAPAILFGHSMGGVIAQKCFAERTDIPGLCLVASSPLRPAPGVIMKMMSKRPVSLLLGQLLNDPVRLRRALSTFFLSPDLSAEDTKRFHDQLSLESPVAMKEIFSRPTPEFPEADSRPVHIIAGRDDWSIPIKDHEKIAQIYRAQIDICPGAHGLMLDPKWEKTATSIKNWLSENFAQHRHGRTSC